MTPRLLSALLCLTLAGCTPTSPAAGPPPPSEATTLTSATTPATDPTQPETPPGDPTAHARRLLDDYAFPPGGPYPAGSIHYAEWEHHCLQGFGFSPRLITAGGNDPGTVTDVPAGQQDTFDDALAACRDVALESGDIFILRRTEAEARRVYAGYLRVHQCLVDHGYPVDQPPPEEAFVAQWVDGGDPDDWHPYSATPAGGPLTVIPDAEPSDASRQQLEIQATCPADWGAVLADHYPGG